jgi:hypothetical protein
MPASCVVGSRALAAETAGFETCLRLSRSVNGWRRIDTIRVKECVAMRAAAGCRACSIKANSHQPSSLTVAPRVGMRVTLSSRRVRLSVPASARVKRPLQAVAASLLYQLPCDGIIEVDCFLSQARTRHGVPYSVRPTSRPCFPVVLCALPTLLWSHTREEAHMLILPTVQS